MTTKQIDSLLPVVMRDIGEIAKKKRNEHQRYNFRGIDDVLNSVGPAMTANSVSQSIEIVEYKEDVRVTCDPSNGGSKFAWVTFATMKMRVTLIAPDGSSRFFDGIGSAVDHNGDKAMNKAHSAAYKYAILLGLAVPVEARELDDSDHDPAFNPQQQGNNKPANGNGQHAEPTKDLKKADMSGANVSPKQPSPAERALAMIKAAKDDHEMLRLKAGVLQRHAEGVISDDEAKSICKVADERINSYRQSLEPQPA